MGADRKMARLAFLNVYPAVEINGEGYDVCAHCRDAGIKGYIQETSRTPNWEEQTAGRVSDSSSEMIKEEWMAD